ncbi:MAG: aminomethyltransferase family protein [Rhodobacteraceae bacterium]|nr:aminomethyltransferase family protein [Paracoccaceae bacterium]
MGLWLPFERAGTRGGARVPGLPVLPHGTERHRVPGGGSRAVRIFAGDEIWVVDREGMQPAELVFFAPDGRSDAGMIGARGSGPATGLQAALVADPSGRRVLGALDAGGFDLGRADAARFFTQGSRAGDHVRLQASCDGLLIVCAPGGAPDPAAQSAPTELLLYVRRADPGPTKGGLAPPDPLAEPLLDINIQPGEAKAYEVRAGHFIQILDVQGRECSDFQALSLRGLDRGREREIDPTATRSMTGQLYPRPGLAAKYWNTDLEPLVEIVQDTCGRHDTFGLACTARYYDDMGYPGHVNCTDNINRDLARWNVRPRGGWPAINFFFNTMLDDAHALGLDDPWTRPGDYVLLRALTDLVCVSTACPDDIDAANGWNPTDIQVRVYARGEDFQPSRGFRMTADSPVEATRRTAFHACFARHTRDFAEYNGYWLPARMTAHGAVAEYWACREKAVVIDLSPLRKYEVLGPDAERLMDLAVTRDMTRLAVGQAVYTAVCHEHGGMLDDGIVFRLGAHNFRWVGGSDLSGLHLREQAQARGLDVHVRSATDHLCNIALQGRASREILRGLIWTAPAQPALDELAPFRFAVARIGGYDGLPIVLSRTGYTGELGYEIFCHPRDAEAVFDAVWQAGQPHGLIPCGLEALDMLRIEAGLIFAGAEFCDQTDPFEAGIGFTVPLKTKAGDFIGRAALEERAAHPQRRLVGLDLEGGIVPARGDGVFVGRARVGQVTSATRSPILGRVIALARLDVTHAAIGTAVEVGRLDGQQVRLPAQVVRTPHFDPGKERVRGNYG